MKRWVVWSIALIISVLTLVGGVIITLVWREQAEILARYATERQEQVDRATGDVERALASAVEDFRSVVRLLRTGTAAQRKHDLAGVLATVKTIHRIDVFGSADERLLSVTEPVSKASLQSEASRRAMAESAGRAVSLAPGPILVSPRIPSDPRGWFRVFAAALPPEPSRPAAPVAVAVLVDTQPFFAALGPLQAESGSHLLVLDPSGHPTPATSPALLHLIGETELHGSPGLHALLGEIRLGRRGTASIQRTGDPLVAAFGPIRVEGAPHWSLAIFSSTAALRSERRAAMLRRALVAGVLAGCLLGLAVFIYFAARRTTALRDRSRHAAELAYLHEKTEKILDNIPTGIVALSDAEIAVAINRVLRERMPRPAIGAPLSQVFAEAPSDTILRLRELIKQTRQSGQVASLRGELLDLFGEEERYNIHVVPLEPRIPDTRFLLVIEDLSAVRALESQLLRAEKLATVGVLSAGIAHELGTPLGVVRGRAEYVLGKLGSDHPQARGLTVIIEQIDRVSDTLWQLLDFSRVEPAVVESVGVSAVVDTVLGLLRLETERRQISTRNEVSAAVPELAADAAQLQQALVNLVLNACDASAPGGRVTVRARLEEAAPAAGPRRVRIEVDDDGCGIPEENRNQVFDPFFTTKKRGAGSGLGLSVVAQIVRNHRGEIELESEPGRGTRVALLWPAASPEPVEARAVA